MNSGRVEKNDSTCQYDIIAPMVGQPRRVVDDYDGESGQSDDGVGRVASLDVL
jgi:hypothetical protein